MGIIGTQLFALAWGIDHSQLHQLVKVRDKSWSNSQVLPRDYKQQNEIELVIREVGMQVASRMRHHQQQAGCINLAVGFSYADSTQDGRGGFSHSMRIDPTDSSHTLIEYLLKLFRQFWEGQSIRNIMVGFSKLSPSTGMQLNLFQNPQRQIKNDSFERVLDRIRDRFGITALIPASSLLKGGTMIERASLVGGHNGGNSYD